MPRTKQSTRKLAPKSKQNRKKQLQNLWKARKEAKLAAVQQQVTSECAQVEPNTSCYKPSTTDSLLGTRTRSQFKKDAYESLDSSCSHVRVNDSVEEKFKVQRGIVDFGEVESLVGSLCCPQCKGRNLSLATDSKPMLGFAVYAEVKCTVCQETIYQNYLASKDTQSKVFNINRQAVYASMVCGMGASALRNFCENLDLPAMHHKTFHQHANKMFSKVEDFRNHVFGETVTFVRDMHFKHSGLTLLNLKPDDIIDIPVSYDGTWMTRGHTSHIGVGCVVDLLTGLCIDAHVMSTYCQVCETTGKKLLHENPEQHATWAIQHMDKCEANYKGSSGMMEVEAARVMWRRSSEKHKLRYTTLLSDGDSKTYTEINNIKPYGEDVQIEKEECVNHVSKRLGTALRNVVIDCRKRGVTLGGRGRGQLTANTMRKLQIYYSRAVRGNSDVSSMKKAIMASLYHGFSTDENPQHHFCPTGEDSWCFFQQSIARHQPPGPHQRFVHTPLNEHKLAEHLLPIYSRLTEEHLLSRCCSGKTQNANESLHSLIWSRCTKDKFASRKRVEFAVITAVREFNFGAAAAADSARFFGFQTGHHMARLCESRMRKRLNNSTKYVKDKAIKRRDKVRAARTQRQEELNQLEGGPAYGAGLF